MKSVSRIDKSSYLMYIVMMFVCMGCVMSCSQKKEANEGTIAKTVVTIPYTEKQMLMISTSQRNAVNKAYTEEIWSSSMDKEGHTYDEVFEAQMKEFFIRLYVMSMSAQSRGLILTDKENEAVLKLSNEYLAESCSGWEGVDPPCYGHQALTFCNKERSECSHDLSALIVNP